MGLQLTEKPLQCIGELVHYGSERMVRSLCPICNKHSFIIDERYDCCGTKFDGKGWLKERRVIECRFKRKKPSIYAIRYMLDAQNDVCFYCGREFNEFYLHPKTKRLLRTKMHFDHFVPFSYSQDNRECNFVISCSICNLIKSDKIFLTEEDARDYVRYRRKKKGYEEAFESKMHELRRDVCGDEEME